ncbi:MAG: transporter substrate-binding domain-containing protein, partial [Alphaproteobacteria bacterium]
MKFSKAYTSAVLLALCVSGTAFADGYDTSGIAVNPELAARVPARIKEAGVLIIGSDTAYAPWEYIGEDGQTPEGIDVDIANAVGRKLGVKIDFQTAAFDAIIPALGTKYDLGISAFSVTNERMKVVNFVNYFVSTSLWAVKA